MTTVWIAAGVTAAACAVIAGVRWLRRSVVQLTIDGHSMSPNLNDGDVVLVRRTHGAVRAGEIVAVAPLRIDGPAPEPDVDADASGGPLWIIKRVAAVPGDPIPPDLESLSESTGQPVPDGYAVLLGDNPDHSYDSRQEGLIDLNRVRGRILQMAR